MLRNKHFINHEEWTKQELDTVFDLSFDLKRKFAVGESHRFSTNSQQEQEILWEQE